MNYLCKSFVLCMFFCWWEQTNVDVRAWEIETKQILIVKKVKKCVLILTWVVNVETPLGSLKEIKHSLTMNWRRERELLKWLCYFSRSRFSASKWDTLTHSVTSVQFKLWLHRQETCFRALMHFSWKEKYIWIHNNEFYVRGKKQTNTWLQH